jgi:hypothetical protein
MEENEMSDFAVVYTDLPDSEKAGHALGLQIREAMLPHPDAVILFAAPLYNHAVLLHALKDACNPEMLVGCSSAGEFTTDAHGEGLACALAISSTEMEFNAGVGREVSRDYNSAVGQVVGSFRGLYDRKYHYRTALVLADVLSGRAEVIIETLSLRTKGMYQFFGGGAGDNAQFQYTPVFYNEEVVPDGVVALEILSNKPLGIGVRHGWQSLGEEMRVTTSEGTLLVALDDRPAVEAFKTYARETRQKFNPESPMPFFLHNLLGINVGAGYKLRVPLQVNADGSILCAADIPDGTRVKFMCSNAISTTEAARMATMSAMQKLYGARPAIALFFDCVATRLRMGYEFGQELGAVQHTLGDARYVGCNSHGQIARAEGQFSGFHNCTAVVCVFPA